MWVDLRLTPYKLKYLKVYYINIEVYLYNLSNIVGNLRCIGFTLYNLIRFK